MGALLADQVTAHPERRDPPTRAPTHTVSTYVGRISQSVPSTHLPSTPFRDGAPFPPALDRPLTPFRDGCFPFFRFFFRPRPPFADGASPANLPPANPHARSRACGTPTWPDSRPPSPEARHEPRGSAAFAAPTSRASR